MGNRTSVCCVGEYPSIDIVGFKDADRILVTADMSTECDDECALLWLLDALNKRKTATTIELLMSDSQARYQWMQHIFNQKLKRGIWEVRRDGCSIQVGCVLINLYLAPAPDREGAIIDAIQAKAPGANIKYEVYSDGETQRKRSVTRQGEIHGSDYLDIPGGELQSITIAAPIPYVADNFFSRFTSVKHTFVVGSPGGINCPMPYWGDQLAALHELGPVLYLTPQFTRGVRFPRCYVLKNLHWNDMMKRTIFDSTLTCMARRPEIAPGYGSWGLFLRLNAANAMMCKDWYRDVMGEDIATQARTGEVVGMVQAYVDRNSGDDRQVGDVVNELKLLGVDVSPATRGPEWSRIDKEGQPETSQAKEAVRADYRAQLFEQAFICVQTAFTLIWNSQDNCHYQRGNGNFSLVERHSGYMSPYMSLADIYGSDKALKLVMKLPLNKLTPAYDVVGMMCAVANLENNGIDTLGLEITEAEGHMGKDIMTQDQLKKSSHPIRMVVQQTQETVDGKIQSMCEDMSKMNWS